MANREQNVAKWQMSQAPMLEGCEQVVQLPNPALQTHQAPQTRHDVADYVATMLESLESLSQKNGLDVLSLMLAMARDQALDDARTGPQAAK